MTGLVLGMLEQELASQLAQRQRSQEEEDRLQNLLSQQKERRQVIEDRITDLSWALKTLKSNLP